MVLLLLLLSVAWVEAALDQLSLPTDTVDYVVSDLSTDEAIATDWRDPQSSSPGSLLKPFVALAYAREHGLSFPQVECTGDTCWLPAGHGQVNIERALAHSCNTYFRQLSQQVSAEEVGIESSRLGLRAPPPMSPPNALWGLLHDWLSTPQEILRAYAELVRRRSEPGPAIVLRGLRQAALSGTASALAAKLPQDAFAKTGTAACAHAKPADGDGFAVAVYPANAPRYAVVVRVHNRTGRIAAGAAAAILAALTSR
jgi:membrane peptidoglycan carboxypeptidase